jgi:hypothetical protein
VQIALDDEHRVAEAGEPARQHGARRTTTDDANLYVASRTHDVAAATTALR